MRPCNCAKTSLRKRMLSRAWTRAVQKALSLKREVVSTPWFSGEIGEIRALLGSTEGSTARGAETPVTYVESSESAPG